MKEKIVISLDQKEQIELEQIVIDDDEKQALEFLKKIIKQKFDKANMPGCKPAFEWSGKEPEMLKEMKRKTKRKKKENK